MRKFLLILLSVSCSISYAQTNSLEAKAAYLLAEESYGKGAMNDALQYLDEAILKLGTANAKVLYLKIMTLKELSAKNKAFDSKLDSAIAAFEKAPDAEDFNEEKSLEVMKVKMERTKIKKQANQLPQLIDAFQQHTGWVIGMSADSAKMIQKNLNKGFYETSIGD